ncbi:MAG: hypothetical protein Q8K79_07340 [Solirubrobacteraceae bacterium]|nr:hypothetical protein [Solirubrobacteraceae bacterium]
MTWLKILDYGDFYDVPRCIVVERDGALYAFDCPFDEDIDDYRASYEVFRLPDSARDIATQRSVPWDEVLRLGERVGTVAVSTIRFDTTKRNSLHQDAFEGL